MYCKLSGKEIIKTEECLKCLELNTGNEEICTWMEPSIEDAFEMDLALPVVQPVSLQSDIVYVVKSHKRLKRFKERTWEKIILKYGFPLVNVHIFVSTEEDFKSYNDYYKECYLHLAPAGVAAVDNYITDYFPTGQKIIYMNDDVHGLYKLIENKKFQEITVEELNNSVDKMFSIMKQFEISNAGFYNIMNGMFMENASEWNTGLCFVQDPFSLVINNKDIRVTIPAKSDYDKSIQHFISKGALLRYNKIVFKVENFVSEGGYTGRTAATEKESAEELMAKFPDHVAGINIKDKGTTSIRLKKIPSNKKIVIDGKEWFDIQSIHKTENEAKIQTLF